jgi:hypothetical protein
MLPGMLLLLMQLLPLLVKCVLMVMLTWKIAQQHLVRIMWSKGMVLQMKGLWLLQQQQVWVMVQF